MLKGADVTSARHRATQSSGDASQGRPICLLIKGPCSGVRATCLPQLAPHLTTQFLFGEVCLGHDQQLFLEMAVGGAVKVPEGFPCWCPLLPGHLSELLWRLPLPCPGNQGSPLPRTQTLGMSSEFYSRDAQEASGVLGNFSDVTPGA